MLGSALCKGVGSTWCSVVIAKPRGMRVDHRQKAAIDGSQSRLTEIELVQIAVQIAEVVEHLHAAGLWHGSLQLCMCYVDTHMRVSLFDEYAAACEPLVKAPGQQPDCRCMMSDVWNLGTFILALFTSHESMLRIIEDYMMADLDVGLPSELVPTAVQAIIKYCLDKNPQQRPTAKQVVEHLWQLLTVLSVPTPAVSPGSEVTASVATATSLNELSLHCQLLRVGSSVSKPHSILVVSELVVDPAKRDKMKDRFEDQEVLAQTFAQAFQITMDQGVEYMPLETQSLVSNAVATMMADSSMTAFHKVSDSTYQLLLLSWTMHQLVNPKIIYLSFTKCQYNQSYPEMFDLILKTKCLLPAPCLHVSCGESNLANISVIPKIFCLY